MEEDSEGPFEEAEFHIRSRDKRPRCLDPTKEYKSPAGFELKDPFEDYVPSCSSEDIPPRAKRCRAKPATRVSMMID